MDKPVMIFGHGPLTRAAIEIFRSNGIEIYGILDDNKEKHGQEMDDISVLGKTNDDGYLKFIGKKAEAFIAADDNALRKSLTKMLIDRRKTMPMNAVHQQAHISESAHIGHGNFINLGAVVGAGAEIGSHALLHSRCLIDHGAEVADFAQVGAGAVVGSQASIGENAFIGTGAVVVSGIRIGKNARVGAGSVVIANVGDGETVFGNPAQKMEE